MMAKAALVLTLAAALLVSAAAECEVRPCFVCGGWWGGRERSGRVDRCSPQGMCVYLLPTPYICHFFTCSFCPHLRHHSLTPPRPPPPHRTQQLSSKVTFNNYPFYRPSISKPDPTGCAREAEAAVYQQIVGATSIAKLTTTATRSEMESASGGSGGFGSGQSSVSKVGGWLTRGDAFVAANTYTHTPDDLAGRSLSFSIFALRPLTCKKTNCP